MDSENPYAAPDSPGNGVEIDVAGSYLIVGRRARLPKRCVFTNQPTGWASWTRPSLRWTGSGGRVVAKTCDLVHGTCWKLRLQIWQQTIGGFLIILGAMGLFVGAIGSNQESALWGGALLAAGFAVAWWAGDPPKLKVTDYQEGRFWIEGCSAEFLEQLASDLGLATSAALYESAVSRERVD